MNTIRTQNLVLELRLAEELKALAYARHTTVDKVLSDLILHAASDKSGAGGCRRTSDTRRQSVVQAAV